MGISGLSAEDVRGALHDLEQLGIASNDTVLTAFVHEGVERSSQKRFNEAIELEIALIAQMREAARIWVWETHPPCICASPHKPCEMRG